MNNITIIGRLTKDPEIRYTQSMKMYARFTVAVNRKTKKANGEYETDFISCIAWNKLAEVVSMYSEKGKRIAIIGRLQIGSYEAQDGTKRKTADVIAEQVEIIDYKENGQYTAQGLPEDNFKIEVSPDDKDAMEFVE